MDSLSKDKLNKLIDLIKDKWSTINLPSELHKKKVIYTNEL